MKSENSKGFTLVELMVVIAVIAILSGVTFRLMSAASVQKQRAETISKMARLENALSGYYAIYGTYPPVALYASQNLNDPGTDDMGETMSGQSGANRAKFTAGAQPVRFLFPYSQMASPAIQALINEDPGLSALGALEAHNALGNLQLGSDDWSDNRVFCFGLMSYLLPRVELIGYLGMGNNIGISDEFFKSAVWSQQGGNSSSSSSSQGVQKGLGRQRVIENEACAKWLPNLKGIVNISGGHKSILGVEITPKNWGSGGWASPVKSGNVVLVLQQATVVDGWGREFYYYSAPPYQSYRLWSAGPDGETFPPWIPSTQYDSLGIADLKANTIRRWVSDDLVAGATGGQ